MICSRCGKRPPRTEDLQPTTNKQRKSFLFRANFLPLNSFEMSVQVSGSSCIPQFFAILIICNLKPIFSFLLFFICGLFKTVFPNFQAARYFLYIFFVIDSSVIREHILNDSRLKFGIYSMCTCK